MKYNPPGGQRGACAFVRGGTHQRIWRRRWAAQLQNSRISSPTLCGEPVSPMSLMPDRQPQARFQSHKISRAECKLAALIRWQRKCSGGSSTLVGREHRHHAAKDAHEAKQQNESGSHCPAQEERFQHGLGLSQESSVRQHCTTRNRMSGMSGRHADC